MDEEQILYNLSRHRPPALLTLGGSFLSLDSERQIIHMAYDVDESFCHSGSVVQGGFITGMIDAAMAYVVIGLMGPRIKVPTLEIKVSFISPGNPGRLVATGRIVHAGKSTVFLAGDLHQNDRLVATATSTAKLIRLSERPS